MSKKAKKIFWGIVLIAVALFIILKCSSVNLGFVSGIPVISLILTAILLSITIGSIVSRNYWAIPLELAGIFKIYEKELAYAVNGGTNLINDWLLLGCALLAGIGVSMLFSGKHLHVVCESSSNDTKFSSQTKYIDCTDFDNYSYSVKMGDGDVFFENIENYKGGGVLNVSCKMGNLTVHVPSGWHLETHIESSMGEVSVPGEGNLQGPLLTINGSNKMGDMTVVFC